MSTLQDTQPGIEAIEYWLPDQVIYQRGPGAGVLRVGSVKGLAGKLKWRRSHD
ncbi:hypothetical protein [uncultured Fretibacterium sp.]|uniref:hypothetical protein n=1 Tax=uncultured Fretibacterium sp. TaxID=1678694 RepID=UPI002631C7F4|nr:hypothetical protein [uncultured Fretibacterium sp.]